MVDIRLSLVILELESRLALGSLLTCGNKWMHQFSKMWSSQFWKGVASMWDSFSPKTFHISLSGVLWYFYSTTSPFGLVDNVVRAVWRCHLFDLDSEVEGAVWPPWTTVYFRSLLICTHMASSSCLSYSTYDFEREANEWTLEETSFKAFSFLNLFLYFIFFINFPLFLSFFLAFSFFLT